jgi:adenylosuccinate synthase
MSLIKPQTKPQIGRCVPLTGLQYGDEGKGKLVEKFSEDYFAVARFGGGSNAGHSLIVNGKTIVLNTHPSGAFTDKINVIGPGVVINPILLQEEIEKIIAHGGNPKQNLRISDKCALVLPTHQLLDDAEELAKGDNKIGSTKNGITPTYCDFVGRNAVRTCDIFTSSFHEKIENLIALHVKDLEKLEYDFVYEEAITQPMHKFYEAVEYLKKFQFLNTEYYFNQLLEEGKWILAEGAQAGMIDTMFGTYPFVTSSRTIASAVASSLGIPARYVKESIGVCKMYSTRVGSGPFTTKMEEDLASLIQKTGNEYGARTGRKRDVGWLDLVELNFQIMINGTTSLIITKADILSGLGKIGAKIKICTHYIVDGGETDILPTDLLAHRVEPMYEEFDAWTEDISKVKTFDDLPEQCQRILQFIQSSIPISIDGLSVGPGKDDYFAI